MRRTIILIMTVFLLGLIAVVGVSTWKFQAMRDAITSERNGNIALYRLGGQAQNEVQAVEMAVENLFKATSSTTLNEAKIILNQHLATFTDIIASIQDPKFTAPLAVTASLADGSPGEPLQKSVDVLLSGQRRTQSSC